MSRLLAKLGMQRRTQVAVHAVERHHHARQRPGR
jgi:DNA-binding CsgD family transcriptional regulator